MSRKGVVVLSPVAAPDGAAFDAEIVDAGARRMMLLDSNILIYATYPSHAQLRSFIADVGPRALSASRVAFKSEKLCVAEWHVPLYLARPLLTSCHIEW